MPKKSVGNSFVARALLPACSAQSAARGDVCPLNPDHLQAQDPQPYFKHPNGTLWIGDSLRWLETLKPASVDLVIADPPYNLGKVEWDEFESHDAYVAWSVRWIELVARVLKPTGSLFVCGFSEILADLRRPAAAHFYGCRWLVWFYKNKANLSSDWGRSHESLLHFRKGKRLALNLDDVRIPYGNHTLKYPVHPQAGSSQFGNGSKERREWQPHPKGAKPRDVFEIPVTSNGMSEKTPHPTQKPEELLRKLILATTKEGDLVIDPFSGSGTTAVCAEQLRRRWAGCDIVAEYCSWAALRLQRIPTKSIREWIEFDRGTAARRESIR